MNRIAALAVSVAAGSLLVAQTERTALRSVTAVRHWSLPEVTRVAVEVSGEFHFTTDRLHDPERVYFDIPNAKSSLANRRIYTEQVDDKFLHRVRVALTQPTVTRVVLDIADHTEAVTSQLSNPDRLIIELRKAPAGSPVTMEKPPVVQTPAPVAVALPLNAKVEAPKPNPPAPVEPEPKPAEPARTQLGKVDPSTAAPSVNEIAKAASAVEAPPARATLNIAPPAAPFKENEVARAARRDSLGETSLVRALGLKVTRVVIDPGHGGHDQGTQGAKGLLEKDLVLDVAKRVGKLIEDRMGAEVIYTRSDDTFIPLEGRTALANDRRADLFLSIHANSSPASRISGVETYYLNFTDMKDSLDVASRENASSQKSIFELRDIIQKITLHDKAEESKEFANRLQSSLYAFEAKNFPASRNRGVKKAPFVVLIGATMPSVLAEIGFLSNAREEMLLKKTDYRQRLAEALFKGVSKYAESLSHFQVATASK